MDWVNRLNASIDFIEDNILNDIKLNDIASAAGFSEYHFSRTFSCFAGVTLSQYIRNRKMTLASYDLQNTDMKIINLALKYGYDSPTAFNRAFKSVHGISPIKARKKGVILSAFSPLNFTVRVTADTPLKYRIEEKGEFLITGVKKEFECDLEKSFLEAPKFWRRTILSGKIPKILKYNNYEPAAMLGVSTYDDTKGSFSYYIGAATNSSQSEFEMLKIPPCKWAIFTCIGSLPNAIQHLQTRIVTEWLPTSGYFYAHAPDIEVYFEGNQQKDDYICEVWLPITK